MSKTYQPPIDKFEGEDEYLSNFYVRPVYYERILYKSNEHAYQAAKATNSTDHEYVMSADTPGIAKKRGREIKCREDWNSVKIPIMTVIVRQKFMSYADLANKLISTYPKNLIEGNWWHDTFWGVCNGVGENHLGEILELIRDELLKLKGKNMDAMIDLETLGTSADCVVLTLGAVKYDPFNTEEPAEPLYTRINVEEQTEKGRIIDEGTVAWWQKQPQAAQDEAFSELDRISMDDVTSRLNKYLVGVNKIWAQGPLFDIIILEDIYKMLGKPVPWAYWQVRDSRTVFDMGDDSIKTKNTDAHNALSDALSQAKAVQAIYKSLGVKKK